MDFILYRQEFSKAGIFGVMGDYQTLEHAYEQPDGSYAPKLPMGTYTCKISRHQLHNATQPFMTYEVLNVPGHTGILFHVGNTNSDSDGCILLGRSRVHNVILESKYAWSTFMQQQGGAETFQLTVC